MLDKLRSDLVQALRGARRSRGPAAAAIVALGLGIGLTSAMFAVADPFLMRPLPYTRPHELVAIDLRVEPFAVGPVSIPTLRDWQSRPDLFQRVAAYRRGPDLRLRTPGGIVALGTVEVTDDFLAVLGAPAPDMAPGSIDGAGELRIAVAADLDWLPGGSPVGRGLVRQDGGTARIVSVLPRTFLFPRPRQTHVDALIFVQPPALAELDERPDGSFSARSWTVVARLRDGTSDAAAQEALRASLASGRGLTVVVRSLTSSMRDDRQPLALGALAAGALILLICAANLGTLFLARAAHRTRELATRQAIGARRRDLSRLMLVELAVLTVGGLLVGLGTVHVALAIARVVIPGEYAALGTPAVTGRVVAFASLSGSAVMIVGFMPTWIAWCLGRRRLVGAAALCETRTARTLRMVIAATQSAIAVVLLSGAALLLRSYVNLAAQDTGFAANVFVASASYPPGHVGARLQADIDATIERLRLVPGVVAVGAATGPMVDDLRVLQIVRVNGRAAPVERKHVSPGYLDAVGTPVLQGRSLVADDRRTGALVNESFANHYWPGIRAISQQMMLGARPATVVGVVRDTFDIALDRPPEPMVFTLLDEPAVAFRVNYAVRLARMGDAAPARVAREIAAVNVEAVVVQATSLRGRLTATVKDRTFATLVLTFFAVAGLGVCATGLVGIVAFVVVRRTREIAIRMALGATPSRIRGLVLREALGAAVAGAIAGLVGGRWLSRTLESLLYGVTPGDVPATVIAALAIVTVVGVASAVPLRRAVQLSPAESLRID